MPEVLTKSTFTKKGEHKPVNLYKRYSLKQTLEAAIPSLYYSTNAVAPGSIAFNVIDSKFCKEKKIPLKSIKILSALVLIYHTTHEHTASGSAIAKTLNLSLSSINTDIISLINSGLVLRVKTGKQGQERPKTTRGKRYKPLYFISINGHAVLSEFYDYCLLWFENLKKELNKDNSTK